MLTSGYACRTYRAVGEPPIEIAVVIAATRRPAVARSRFPWRTATGSSSPAGMATVRPSRDPQNSTSSWPRCPIPPSAELTQLLEPVGDVAIHRQTGNRRNPLRADLDAWPAGLLAVGRRTIAPSIPSTARALRSAACQALLILDALKHDRTPTGEDRWRPGGCNAASARRLNCPGWLRRRRTCAIPAAPARRRRVQRLIGLWTGQLARLAAMATAVHILAFARVYHLMAAPALLFHPSVIISACRAALRGMPEAESAAARVAEGARPESGTGALSPLRQAQGT